MTIRVAGNRASGPAEGTNVRNAIRSATQPSAVHGKRFQPWRVPRESAFWVVAGVFCPLFVATAAPAPLYRVYQARWRFSANTLTTVYALLFPVKHCLGRENLNAHIVARARRIRDRISREVV